MAAGFHPTFGIHHDNQLNAFNLADDLIEPYRAIVDIVAQNNIGSNIQLSKNERREIAHVLHNACMIDAASFNVDGRATIAAVTPDARGILQGTAIEDGIANASCGVLDVKKYNETVSALMLPSNQQTADALKKLGYNDSQIKELVEGFKKIATNDEWGDLTKYDSSIGNATGVFGVAAPWKELSGGANQFTSRLPYGTMYHVGLITDLTSKILING